MKLRPSLSLPRYAGSARWAMKLDFVIGALKACARAPPPRVVAFADVDIVAHRPFAAAMRAYLRGRDLVFQADNGFKVVGNLGLMAMRCNARVLRLWEVGRARAATAVSGMKPRPFPPPPCLR